MTRQVVPPLAGAAAGYRPMALCEPFKLGERRSFMLGERRMPPASATLMAPALGARAESALFPSFALYARQDGCDAMLMASLKGLSQAIGCHASPAIGLPRPNSRSRARGLRAHKKNEGALFEGGE